MKILNKLYPLLITKKISLVLACVSIVAALSAGAFYYQNLHQFQQDKKNLEHNLAESNKELDQLKNVDQVKRNDALEDEIKKVNKTYSDTASTYEKLTDLKAQKQDTSKLDPLYAQIVKYLADKNYASGSATLADLNTQIQQIQAKLAINTSSTTTTSNAQASNNPPGGGFSYQTVSTDGQNYPVAIIAADLNSTKVIVDTASESDCANNCPVMPLADYVSRNGAFAGINGSFFCPPEYPSCAGKTNSFDTLLMNKNKHYFNSDNNVYSTIPAAIFSPGSGRFVSQSLEWGRDTGVDSVIANYPLLIAGGNINFTEAANEPKFGAKGARSFIATKGKNVYIGVIYNATMGESAKVLHTLGIDQALNLDEGGSTALWSGGYKAGPGRNIPNAVLFIKR